jgi:hypothetical protein
MVSNELDRGRLAKEVAEVTLDEDWNGGFILITNYEDHNNVRAQSNLEDMRSGLLNLLKAYIQAMRDNSPMNLRNIIADTLQGIMDAIDTIAEVKMNVRITKGEDKG